MRRKKAGKAHLIPKRHHPYLRLEEAIPGRSPIPGRKEPTFPAFYRVEEKPVTFRRDEGGRSREEREEYVCRMLEMTRRHSKLVMLMIPHEIYSNPKTSVFHSGWTLAEYDGEIRTRQCVVFLAGEAVPVGRSDQGVICVAPRRRLSAWDGRTSEQSRAQAA